LIPLLLPYFLAYKGTFPCLWRQGWIDRKYRKIRDGWKSKENTVPLSSLFWSLKFFNYWNIFWFSEIEMVWIQILESFGLNSAGWLLFHWCSSAVFVVLLNLKLIPVTAPLLLAIDSIFLCFFFDFQVHFYILPHVKIDLRNKDGNSKVSKHVFSFLLWVQPYYFVLWCFIA